VSPLSEEASTLPFLKGKTLKSTDGEDTCAASRIRVVRVSSAEAGENGSTRLGDRSGLPAKAWVRRFMDMVVVGRDSCEKMCLEMSLEDEDGRRSLSILVHERRGCNQVNVRRRQRKH